MCSNISFLRRNHCSLQYICTSILTPGMFSQKNKIPKIEISDISCRNFRSQGITKKTKTSRAILFAIWYTLHPPMAYAKDMFVCKRFVCVPPFMKLIRFWTTKRLQIIQTLCINCNKWNIKKTFRNLNFQTKIIKYLKY